MNLCHPLPLFIGTLVFPTSLGANPTPPGHTSPTEGFCDVTESSAIRPDAEPFPKPWQDEPADLAETPVPPGSLMDTIMITGTRTSRLLDESPVRTKVVDRQEIQRIAARTLADAIEFTPGIRVESNCQNCNETELFILGL